MKPPGAALCVLLLACASNTKGEPEQAPRKKLDGGSVSPSAAPRNAKEVVPGTAVRAFRGPMLTLRRSDAPRSGVMTAPKQAVAGQIAAVGAGETLDLDFDCGARAQVSGPALIAVSARADQGLLVRHGLVRVELPPGAAKPGAPCWLATPALRMELPRWARFVLRAHENGRTEIAVASGRLTLATESMPDVVDSGTQAVAAGRLVRADLTASHALSVSSGPETMEAAATLLAGKAPRTAQPSKPRRLDQTIQERLKGLYVRTMSEVARARELDEQHRALVSAGDKRAMAVQRQIAEQAAITFRARRSLAAVLSRIEAAGLTVGEPSAPDPLLERASELVR